MEYTGARRSSKAFNTLVTSIEETRVVNFNEERGEATIEIVDQLIHSLLKQLKALDPKYSFLIRNLSSLDSENRSVRQFHYFLIWKELSKPSICRLANDDGYFASIEILKDPKTWSRYDLDAHVVKVDRKRYLNGLSLRDDLVKSLMELLKNNAHHQVSKDFVFKEIEFDQSTIRIIFAGKIKSAPNLPPSTPTTILNTSNTNINPNNLSMSSGDIGLPVIPDDQSVRSQTPTTQHSQSTLQIPPAQQQTPQQQQQQQQQQQPIGTVIYVLNINPMIAFSNATPILLNRMKDSLVHHHIYRDYFSDVFEPRFYLLAFNSFKWVYDVVYMEHLLFEYIMEQKSLFTNAYKKLMLIRRSWRKYFQKVLKVVENIKINEKQAPPVRRNTANSSVSIEREVNVRTSMSLYQDSGINLNSISYQFETSIERTLTEYLFRVLFLRQCSLNKTMPENREQFNACIITNIFEELLVILDTKYCESFSFRYKNILPKCCLYFEPAIQTGIVKLIKEIYLDWKRGRFGH